MTEHTNKTSIDSIRESFLAFFESKGHKRVASSSTIPTDDPTVLFTMAGMMQFKSYFVGLEKPPYKTATSSQKCVRAGGKHNDLDDIGRTNRHFTFFEMLGNFSFGDYFKKEAIEYAWEYVTEHLNFDTDKIWVTVHESDDESEEIWQKVSNLPIERIQRLGEDNFWQMGEVGPCGPSTEIFYDLGPQYGEDGGPKYGGENRFVEFWNLVFMQYEDHEDGTRTNLPKPSVDTGAGLERIGFIKENSGSIWDTSFFLPLIKEAEKVTGATYSNDPESDVSLRIMAEHSRTMAFLISDGCVPSNEDRGYVLRRIIRRAVRHAYSLGAKTTVMPEVVKLAIEMMGNAYPELHENSSRILTLVKNEEEKFRETLERGLTRLDELLENGDVTGKDAFYLHDTLGFPIDLTREIAEIQNKKVDLEGFENELKIQADRSRAAQKETSIVKTDASEYYSKIHEQYGSTEFVGRDTPIKDSAKVIGLLNVAGEPLTKLIEGEKGLVILDATPFYAESGGQVGDQGILSSENLKAKVFDTQYVIPQSVIAHHVVVDSGELELGATLSAHIDEIRRNRIRRNHTATHILHWALREVLGDHVKQSGSVVDDQRLRFDFQHFSQVTPEELNQIERLANQQIITAKEVTHEEMSIEEAKEMGAIAFFGEKYGDRVRVLVAGPSIEFCGGTHVDNLGFIGPIRITSEGSIGSNIRRIEAITGDAAHEASIVDRMTLRKLSDELKATPDELVTKVTTLQKQLKDLNKELKDVRSQQLTSKAKELAKEAKNSRLVFRQDNTTPDDLRAMAIAIRNELGSAIVGAIGLNEQKNKAGICVVVSKDNVGKGYDASELVSEAVKTLGGGTAKNAELVVGGGQNIDQIDQAHELLKKAIEEGQ